MPRSLQVSVHLRNLAVLLLCAFLGVGQAVAGSMTLLGVGGPAAGGGGLMLDGITTGIKAAYSTRKLLTAYAGNAVQIERASDSATSNIGFSANVLDTSTINTFCSATTCRVISWYDQSGGGFDLIQATFANAPEIYVSGSIFFINTTRPAIAFRNTNSWRLGSATLAQNPVNTLFVNAVITNTVGGRCTIISNTVANNFDISLVSTGNLFPSMNADDFASLGTATSGITSTGSVMEAQYNSSTGAGSFWIDGAATGTFTNAHTMAGGGAFQVGIDSGGNASDANIGELVMYDLVGGIPSGSRTSIEANQKAYWGTP